MTKLRRRVWVTCTAAVTWALAGALAAAAQTPLSTPDASNSSPDKVAFRIDAQPIDGALKQFASQANLQLVYETAEVSPNIRSSHVAGAYTPEAALSRLLAHTNLDYKFINDRTVSIRSANGASLSRAHPETSVPLDVQSQFASPKSAEIPGGSSEQAGAADVTGEPDNRYVTRRKDLEEVVVTAQKREERLQDVPVPVTAISAQMLVDSNQLRLQDYYTSIPGLVVTPSTQGNPNIFIRGITTGTYTNPSVGITVDDVPYGSSTTLGGGSVVPDLDPSELQRVEVLRGPQGTLYGASSIGGLVKFVTVNPSTDGVSGRLQADVDAVHNGGGAGYGVRGAANVPLSDTFALRASAFSRRDPGYIDNVQTGQRGVNRQNAYGGHLSALWRPSKNFSLKLSALLQDSRRYGFPDVGVGPDIGDLQQSVLLGVGGFDRKYEVYSAVVTAKLGAFDLTAISGYSINRLSDSSDATEFFGSLTQGQFGVTGTAFTETNRTSKFTQEFRLGTTIGKTFDWLFGGFYTHEKSPYVQSYLAQDGSTSAVLGTLWNFNFPTKYEEYAAFTDLTIHFMDRFDLQVGGREGHNKQTYNETDTGPLATLFEGQSPLIFPQVVTQDSAFTYLVTPRFKVSPALMVYARLASGYRPGGPNPSASALAVPNHYNPDKTLNYELGVKGEVLDHVLSFDASLYYIDWKDIQLSLVDPSSGLSYYANGSRAKSEGVELSFQLRPVSGLKIGAWVSWNEAVLTESLPVNSPVFGVGGTRLPYSPRISGSLSVDDEFSLPGNWKGFVGGTLSYVGDREGTFTSQPPPPRPYLPPYARTDLRAGVRYDAWTANLFANNVADKRGVLLNDLPIVGVNLIQPRTIGMSVSKTF